MAEMIVWLVDTPLDAETAKNALPNYKAGDVICIKPDGWKWGSSETGCPDWAIVKVPGASVDDLSAYLAAPKASATSPRRSFNMDVAQVQFSKNTATLPLNDALSIKVAKAVSVETL